MTSLWLLAEEYQAYQAQLKQSKFRNCKLIHAAPFPEQTNPLAGTSKAKLAPRVNDKD